jgi:chloramphenicol 3-O-phosphotransferase
VAQAARACVRTLLDLGHQVIFDAVLVNETGARSLLEDFRDHAPLHVALTCSWQEIERRTRARGDRTLAEARHGFCHAGPHGGPDLAFDTTGLAPDGIVADVVAALRCGR